MERIGQSVDGIGVIERLGSKSTVQYLHGLEGSTVVDIGIRLHNKDKLLAGMVEVEFDSVAGASDGLVTSELQLLDEVLMGVLSHTSALISI